MGIRKSELIDLYNKLGYTYLDMTLDELGLEPGNVGGGRYIFGRRLVHLD